jgi:hypothetical protein
MENVLAALCDRTESSRINDPEEFQGRIFMSYHGLFETRLRLDNRRRRFFEV